MGPASWIIFEDERLVTVVASWYPELLPRLMSARELVGRLSEAPVTSVPVDGPAIPFDGEDPVGWWRTLVALREALVLTVEDAEYAFSVLPPTPKNRALRSAFQQYLEGPALTDWTARVWALIERLKSLDLHAGLPARLTFVRGLDTGYLFTELTKAFGYAPEVETVSVVEPWELRLPEPDPKPGEAVTRRRAIFFRGSCAPSLERGGRRILQWLERGVDPTEITCVTACDPAAEELFRLFLSHHRIPCSGSPTPPAEAAVPGSETKLLEALRRDTSRPLKRRLELCAILGADTLGRRQSTPWVEFLTRLESLGTLGAEDVAYCLSLLEAPPAPRAPSPAVAPRGVSRLSTLALPEASGRKTLALLGPEALEPRPAPLALRRAEVEALHQAGFTVPRASDLRARRLAALDAWRGGALERPIVFTWMDLRESLPAVRLLALPRVAENDDRDVVPFEAERVRLPPKPLSATQLETYAQCPAKYFFGNRLRLRHEMTSDGQYPLLFGQLVHSALEHYFKGLAGNALPREPEKVAQGLMEIFHRQIALRAPTLEASHPFHLILCEHFKKLIRHVPRLEASLESIVGRAERRELEKDFALEIAGLPFKGKIDRLDETGDGAVVVIDYKTGTVDFSPNHVYAGEHFQALLYWLAAEQLCGRPCAGVLFYDLKKGELRRGILLSERVRPDAKKSMTRGHCLDDEAMEKLRAEGMRHLSRLAERIGQGDFTPTASPAVCEFCEFPALCRRGAGYV